MKRLSLVCLLIASTAWGQDPDLEGMPGLPDLDAPGLDVPAALPELAPPTQSNTSFRGQWQSRVLGDLQEDREGEDVIEVRNQLELELTSEINPKLTAVVGGRITHESRAPHWDFAEARALGEAELREGYLAWQSGPLRLTGGHQTIRWGSTEANSPNDVLAPIDLRQGLQPGLQTPALPQVAAQAIYTFDDAGRISAEMVVLPFFTPHRVDLFGRDTAPVPSGSPFVLLASGLRASTPRSVQEDVQPLLVAFNPPDEHLGNASGGARLSLRGSGWDLNFNSAYLWDRTPAIRISPGGLIPIESTTHRQLTLGADGVLALGDFTLKADAAWSQNRVLYTEGLTPARSPVVSWAGGVDWLPHEDFSITVECFGFMPLEDAPEGEVWLLIGDHLINAVMFARYQPESSDWGFTVAGQRGLTRGDFFVSPQVEYSPASGHQLALGVAIIHGPDDSLGGVIKHNDQGTLRYTIAF
ncbi:MAG: hypothetical protein ACE366_08145 [Bradymonadia bacterium]